MAIISSVFVAHELLTDSVYISIYPDESEFLIVALINFCASVIEMAKQNDRHDESLRPITFYVQPEEIARTFAGPTTSEAGDGENARDAEEDAKAKKRRQAQTARDEDAAEGRKQLVVPGVLEEFRPQLRKLVVAIDSKLTAGASWLSALRTVLQEQCGPYTSSPTSAPPSGELNAAREHAAALTARLERLEADLHAAHDEVGRHRLACREACGERDSARSSLAELKKSYADIEQQLVEARRPQSPPASRAIWKRLSALLARVF